MKTYKNLIDYALSDECMDEALRTAVKGKMSRPEVKELIKKSEWTKKRLRTLILNRSLKPLIHKAHEINDGFTRKKRIIIQPYFSIRKPEQWIQHIVVNSLQKIFTKGMYEFSCGSVPGRGVHYGKKYLEKFIKKNPKNIKYVLKLDIKKFYQSVPIDILKKRFKDVIKDELMLDLIYFVLDSNVGTLKTGEYIQDGLPIGFYTSQWFANWFLQPLDHYIKEELKAPFYMRYMDDIVIFGPSKKELHKIFNKIEFYLRKNQLKPKENWQIFLFDYIGKDGKRRGRPIDFMGFKFYRDKTIIRKSIFLRACRLARRIAKTMKISWRDACQILSYMGWFYPTNTFKAYEKYIKPFVNINACKKIVSKHNKNKGGKDNGDTLQKSPIQGETGND